MTPWSHLEKRALDALSLLAAFSLLVCGAAACGSDADDPETLAVHDPALDSQDGAAGGTGGGAPAHLVATFLGPDLDEAGVRALVAALAGNPGVVTAGAVPDSALFRVAFTTEKTSAAEVLGVVTKTNERLALRDVVQVSAAGAASACGACPSKATCPGSSGS